MDRTSIDAADVASTHARATFGESRGGISILSTVVPATVAYREAATARQPVHRIERQRRGHGQRARVDDRWSANSCRTSTWNRRVSLTRTGGLRHA